MIVASLIGAIADLLTRFTPLKKVWALWASIILLAVIVIGAPWLFGMQIVAEFQNLIDRLPDLLDTAGQRFGVSNLSDQADELWKGIWDTGMFGSIFGYTSNVIGIVTSVSVVLVGGVFIALDAQRYREGFLQLVPRQHRERARTAMQEMARALRLWLLGQLAAMVVLGGVTTIGLLLLQAPSAIALGLLAGLLEFIPFLGPILAYLAAVIVALTVDLNLVIWVSVLYLGLQQLESNILVPVIQKRTVELPPALGIFALLAISTLFGPPGLLLGVPLTVVILVGIKQIYIRDILHEETKMPGDDEAQHESTAPDRD